MTSANERVHYHRFGHDVARFQPGRAYVCNLSNSIRSRATARGCVHIDVPVPDHVTNFIKLCLNSLLAFDALNDFLSKHAGGGWPLKNLNRLRERASARWRLNRFSERVLHGQVPQLQHPCLQLVKSHLRSGRGNLTWQRRKPFGQE